MAANKRSAGGVVSLAFVAAALAVFSVRTSAQWAGLLDRGLSRPPPPVGSLASTTAARLVPPGAVFNAATPPTVSITSPTTGTTVTGTVTVTADATDDTGVAGVQFQLDGASFGAERAASPYTVAWNTRGSTDLVFAVVKVKVGPMTISAGSGLTKRLGVSCAGCTGDDTVSVDRIQSAPGAAAAAFTFSAPARYVSHMAAFKAATTPAYLQGAAATSNTASTTIAKAFGAPTTAGTLLVAAVAWQGNALLTLADSRGNSYAVAVSSYDALLGQSVAILYAANMTGGAATVTASFGTTATIRRLEIHEYAGMVTTNPLDGTATNSADGTATPDSITSGTVTTTVTTPASNGSHTLTAIARDADDSLTTSATVTVTVSDDPTPPVISNVTVSAVNASGATVTWTTNEASDSQVDFGLTTAYGSTTGLNAAPVTIHTVILNGLTGNTLYHARARSRDAAGNLAVSGDVVFNTVDGTAPTVAITAPAGGATVSNTIPVTAGASDNVGVAGVQFRLDGAPLGAEDTGSPFSVSWNTTTATSGSHTLTAIARDAAGNQTTSAAVAVTVSNDTTPPVISAVGATSITASGATINWTTNEASDSQVDFGPTATYGSTSALNPTLVTAHTVSLSGLSGGMLYHVRVRSSDAAGNPAASGDVTFTTLDNTPPTVSITAPAGGAIISGTTTVSANATDNVGVAGVQFAVDGVPLGVEITTAPDAAPWATAGSVDLIFGVVKVAVGPMTIAAGGGLTRRLGVSCPTCTGDDTVSVDKIQSTAGTAAARFTFSGPAHYHAHVAAFRAATTPVYLQGAAATTNVAGTILAQPFSAPTTAGSLLVVAVAWQGTAPLTVTDSRGNSYAVATTSYDAEMGQSVAILYAANVTAGATTVTAGFGSLSPTAKRLEVHEYAGVSATNPLNGTATNIAEGTTTAGAVTSGAAPTSISAAVSDGSHTLTAVARDAAGNVATSAAVTVTVRNDATPPVVSITAPAAGGFVTGTVAVTANASDNTGVVGVQFKLDGALLSAEDMMSPYSVSWNTATATNASHTLTAVARDAAGNATTSAAIAVTAANDTTPPAISAVTVSSILSTGATIRWTTNEASSSEVEYGLTTAYGGFSALDVSLVTAHTVSLGGLAPNTAYHFRAQSRDASGNLGLSGDFTLTTLEGTPPSVSITAPAAGSTVSGTVAVTANASDNIGVAGVQFQLDGVPGVEDTTAPYTVLWDTTIQPSGAHTLTAVARDAAANWTTSAAVTVMVANSAGQVMLAWDGSIDPNVAGFKVYVGTTSGVYSMRVVDVGNVTGYTVTGLQAGTAYYVAGTAYYQIGAESGFSNEVSTTIP